MNALKILFLLPLSILSFKMTAQIDDLLKNKDITWVAEISSDFIVDNPEKAEAKNLNRIRILKITPKAVKYHTDDSLIFHRIVADAVNNRNVTLYRDSFCVYRYDGIDTIETIDPMTYETKIRIIKSQPHLEVKDIQGIRVRQILFYDAKQAQFGLKTLAFAPLSILYSLKGDTIRCCVPHFWLKAKDLESPPNIADNNISWVQALNQHQGFDLKNAHILKSTDTSMPIEHLINIFEKDESKQFFKANSDMIPNFMSERKQMYAEKDAQTPNADIIPYPLDLVTREGMINWRDTITVIESNEVKVKVITHRINLKKINRLRLIQEWYWDDKKQELSIRLAAVAPIYDACNEINELIYRKPMFYRRTDID